MENDIVVSSSFTMAVFLVANPNVTVRKWEGSKFTDFKYDIETGKFYYRKPSNKVRNKWYEARGLKGHFDGGMKTLLQKKPNEIMCLKVEEVPY